MSTIANPPLYTDLIELDPKGRPLGGRYFMSKQWLIWTQQSLIPPVQSSPTILEPVSLTGQNASIPVTPMPLPSLAAGLYRLTTYARVTTADGVASSLIVTLGWTESGNALSHSFPAMTGNTVNTVDSESIMVEIDQATALNYSTSYASTTLGAMHYRLTVVVEVL